MVLYCNTSRQRRARMCSVLTGEQLAEFNDVGFVVVPDVLSGPEADTLLHAAWEQFPPPEQYFADPPGRARALRCGQGPRRVRRAQQLIRPGRTGRRPAGRRGRRVRRTGRGR